MCTNSTTVALSRASGAAKRHLSGTCHPFVTNLASTEPSNAPAHWRSTRKQGASNSSALQPNFFGVLTSVGKVLTEYDKTVVEVAGHTDSTGSDSHNMALSQRRANTVGEYLYTQGIMDQRIIAVGMGEHHPVADNTTAEGREMNRRVEITLVPVTAS